MPKKVKIAYLIDSYQTDKAGTEKQLMLLLENLPPSKFSIFLIAIQRTQFLEKLSQRIADVQIFILDGYSDISKSLPALFKLYQLLKQIQPNILQTFFPAANSFGVLVGYLAGVPAIISSRRDLGYWYTTKDLILTRVANFFVRGILVNSIAVKKKAIELEKVSGKKITVVYNGIDDQNFPISRLHQSDKKVVTIIANLNRKVKRVDLFIKAAALVYQQDKNVEFWVFGEGPLLVTLQNLATQLGLEDRITFWGRPQNLPELLGQIDIGVNCSDSEGLSNAIMEFMTAGIPTVATKVGGNPELITQHVNGLLVRPDSEVDLATSILTLLNNKDLANTMGASSQKKVKKFFSIDKMIKSTQVIYESLFIA